MTAACKTKAAPSVLEKIEEPCAFCNKPVDIQRHLFKREYGPPPTRFFHDDKRHPELDCHSKYLHTLDERQAAD